MFEKFAEDVIKRTNEKLADILPDRMNIEDWLSVTLEERNRYADSLGEGNYQLFNLGGKPYPAIGQGEESIVYPAIGSTRKGEFKLNEQWMPDYNFVMKKPNYLKEDPFLITIKGLDKQIGYKKDIQMNPKNKIWLPFSDFNGGLNEKAILQQRLLKNRPSNSSLQELVREFNSSILNSSHTKNITNNVELRSGNNLIHIPEIRGKSGMDYILNDMGIRPNSHNRMSNHNMAFDLLGKLKAMDFNALPIWRKK